MLENRENIIELRGQKAGPTSAILIGVHGDERCGIEAIEKLLPSLKIERGRVFVGYGNPKAIERNVRFVEANLNRMFKPDESLTAGEKTSYEYARAQFLKKYLEQSDELLDIHASFTPESQPFIICENNAREIARYLPIDRVVSGFDAAEPGGTDYWMNKNGKIGICIECGYLGDSSSTKIAEASILAFLRARKHLDGELQIRKQENLKVESIYMTKTDGFHLAKNFSDFEKISADHIIGTDGQKEIRASEDGFILFARNRNQIGEEAFLFGTYKKT